MPWCFMEFEYTEVETIAHVDREEYLFHLPEGKPVRIIVEEVDVIVEGADEPKPAAKGKGKRPRKTA
jgi:hypothetical protein